MDQQTSEKFNSWGIVEVMGHKKFAGHITEQPIAGSALVRVDVPEVTVKGRDYEIVVPAFSKLIGAGSIYCITPTTEEIARRCAVEIARFDSDPIPVRLPAERQLAASVPSHGDENDFDDLGDDDDEAD